MSILTWLFGSKSRSPPTKDKLRTFRSLIKSRTPPWHRVPDLVIDAVFEALDHTELFDCFVRASIDNKLVVQYEGLGREHENVSIIRAQISEMLCKAGSQKIEAMQNYLTNNEMENAQKIGLAATDLFEPAIAMSRNQIVAYIGMATVYGLLGVKMRGQEFAKRGLLQLEKTRQTAAERAIRSSTVFAADMYERLAQQLHGYLGDTFDSQNETLSTALTHIPDNTTRIGRRGICMLCGTIKSGSYVACNECGFQPLSDQDLSIALILNEASMRNF
jgi:hypothetical protein